MSEECPRCGAMGGFGCYECTPEPKATISDDLVKQTLHSLEGLDAYVRALDEYNDALVAANEELEAKLEKAVETLVVYEKVLREFATSTDIAADEAEDFLDEDGGKLARATLKELKGDTDE